MKIAALAAFLGAVLTGSVAISIFREGPSLLTLAGTVLGAVSIGLLLLAIYLLFIRRGPSALEARGRRRPQPMPSALSPGQRRGFIVVGMLLLAKAAYSIVTGEFEQVRSSAILREESPFGFWATVMLFGGVGVYLVRRALRRPPHELDDLDRRGSSRPVRPSAKRKEDDAR